jgi:hypothetical protein
MTLEGYNYGTMERSDSLASAFFEKWVMEKPGPPKIRCAVCRKAVLGSAAKGTESAEYVFYFCGRDRYERWQAHSRIRQSHDHTRGAA